MDTPGIRGSFPTCGRHQLQGRSPTSGKRATLPSPGGSTGSGQCSGNRTLPQSQIGKEIRRNGQFCVVRPTSHEALRRSVAFFGPFEGRPRNEVGSSLWENSQLGLPFPGECFRPVYTSRVLHDIWTGCVVQAASGSGGPPGYGAFTATARAELRLWK